MHLSRFVDGVEHGDELEKMIDVLNGKDRIVLVAEYGKPLKGQVWSEPPTKFPIADPESLKSDDLNFINLDPVAGGDKTSGEILKDLESIGLVTGTPPVDPLKFLDRVFYINLDRSVERRKYIEEEIKRVGLWSIAERIEGVEYTGEIPKWFGKKRPRGQMGCALAHLSAFKRAEQLGCKRFMILEDDAKFDLPGDLPGFLGALPEGWGLAYLNHEKAERSQISIRVESINGQFSAYGFIVNCNILKDLINLCDPFVSRKRNPRTCGGIVDEVLRLETDHILKVRPTRQIVSHRYDLISEINTTVNHRQKIYRKTMEADVTHHCNLSCKQCAHLSPHFGESFYDLDQFEKDVAALSNYVTVSKFYLLGGEPLLNPNLGRYVEILRKYDFVENIGLVTNGLLLPKTDRDILRSFDTIDVSIYPSINTKQILDFLFENSDWLPPVRQRHTNEFNEIFVEEPRPQVEVESMFKSCYSASMCNLMHAGKYYLCVMSAKYRYFNQHATDDGVSLHEPNSYEMIAELISRKDRGMPINSCRVCNIHGPLHPHEQEIIPRSQRINPFNVSGLQ
jgi:molybdenum cofactor biosynthesis enzyme MoaA